MYSHIDIENSITDGKNSLFTGNTLDVLRGMDSDFLHLGITSPPYNKQEKQKGWLVKNVVYDTYKDALPESEYQQNQVEVLDEIYRMTVPGGSFFYNHKIRWDRGEMYHPMDWLRQSKWTVKQEIVWDRVIAANIRGWRFWQVDERIYWLYKPIDGKLIGKELDSCDAKMTSIWRGVPESSKNNSHPAPFPLWLPARIIISLLGTDNSRIVLDPYNGSGTTCVAAKLLGHQYIGIDGSKQYIDMAHNRLENAESERHKINEEISLHTVNVSAKERKSKGMHMGSHRKSDEDSPQSTLF